MKEESIDMVAFQQGDVKTFEEIYHQYYTYVMYFARKMTGNTQVAEDIAMDTFRKLWVRRGDFDNQNSLKAWLMITTKNACLSHLNAEKRKVEISNGFKHHQFQLQEDENKSYTRLLEDVVQHLHEEINNLPPKCRAILKFRLQGYNSGQIAKLMGVSISTVKNQSSNAFKKIRVGILNIEHLVVFIISLRGFL